MICQFFYLDISRVEGAADNLPIFLFRQQKGQLMI
jgi:hypothetical protein